LSYPSGQTSEPQRRRLSLVMGTNGTRAFRCKSWVQVRLTGQDGKKVPRQLRPHVQLRVPGDAARRSADLGARPLWSQTLWSYRASAILGPDDGICALADNARFDAGSGNRKAASAGVPCLRAALVGSTITFAPTFTLS